MHSMYVAVYNEEFSINVMQTVPVLHSHDIVTLVKTHFMEQSEHEP